MDTKRKAVNNDADADAPGSPKRPRTSGPPADESAKKSKKKILKADTTKKARRGNLKKLGRGEDVQATADAVTVKSETKYSPQRNLYYFGPL